MLWRYAYDLMGNRILEEKKNPGGKVEESSRYVYNESNQLTEAVLCNGRTTRKVCYTYDGDGNLVKEYSSTDNSLTTYRYGMLAYKCNWEDIFWQDMQDISIYEFYGKSTKGLRTIKSPLKLNEMVIDIEQNPGHSHNVFRVWFGAWHKMWFGEDYYQFVSREKLEKYKNCYENKYLGNNVIRITLFEDIWDFEKKKNRKRQLEFRKFMEIDKAAESYRKNHKADPPVETIFEKGEHGGEKAILYYVDEEGNSSLKSKAKYIKYCEVSANGKILYEELRENI